MSKVLNVFYGADRLPYKDQERQVHYPMVGNSFAGASLVDEIRFYAKDLGTENNVFVGIAKRPDGQRGYQVLTYGYDTELNEPYWTFNVSGWFTEKVGNVFVSLNVYQGGVDIEVDEDSGLAIVSGTPIIQATGSVVLSINYAPVMDNGYGAVPTIDVQEALSLVGSKVNTDYLTANYYNKTTIDSQLLLKADLSYVNGFVKTLEVSMDSSTYVLTFTCKDGTGTTISAQSIDLPLESVVVSGEYDSATQSIILTLQNGNTITIPVSDLVDGLVDTTTFENAIQGIEDELDTKANANEVYTKDEVDGKLDLKADKTTTTSLQNQINDLNSRLVVVEEAIIGVDTLTFTALSYSAIPNVSDNLYPLIQSGGLDTKEVKGNSFVHSQLINHGNFDNTTGWNTNVGINLTVSNNVGTLTYSSQNASANMNRAVQMINTHKYLFAVKVKPSASTTLTRISFYDTSFASQIAYKDFGSVSANTKTLLSGIITSNRTDANAHIIFYPSLTTSLDIGDTVELEDFQCFDLTKDFGAGNEPTTYDQAVSMYASKGIDITNYVEYTQGTLIDSKPIKIISRGYNVFDEEWEQGGISGSNGIPFSSSSYFRTVNFAKVKGGSSYTLENNVGTTLQGINGYVFFYDIDKQFISVTNIYASTPYPVSVNIPNNAVYVKACWSTPLISNAKICFHLTGSRTGYAPYKAPIEYPITTEVLRSAGSVQDSAVSKKVGRVDLGTLNWSYNSSYQTFLCESLVNISPQAVAKSSGMSVLLCAKYQTINVNYNSAVSSYDKVIFNQPNSGARLFIKDTSYTDAATFKTAMSGVILNYELATPTEQTATLPSDIEIEKGGSLEVVYYNGYTTPADFVFDCAVYKPLE